MISFIVVECVTEEFKGTLTKGETYVILGVGEGGDYLVQNDHGDDQHFGAANFKIQ